MSFVEKIMDRTYPGLQKALDLTWKRNQAITSNISNAETPQYRAVDVNFAGELERAFGASTDELVKTNTKHLDVGSAEMSHYVQDYSGATKPDGNNVDIDIQMGQLAFNSGKYSMATSLLRKKLTILKMVVRDAAR